MNYIKTLAILWGILVVIPAISQAQRATQPEDTTARERVRVAFRTIDKEDAPGDVSVVDLPGIVNKNFVTSSLDHMEAFTGGYNGNMWGMNDYLVIVDGAPRYTVNASEIEQVTFLKGVAATALYGSRAAKGVILITTKKGNNLGQKVKVWASTGLYIPKSYPEYLGSAEYMTLYNEARSNDGLDPLYSTEDIYNYSSGSNPYRYPDVDYYSSEYLRKSTNRTDAITEITGGNDKAHYYTNIGFTTGNSLLNFGQGKDENYSRLNVRANVDVKINKFITSWVNVSTIFGANRTANGDYWEKAATLRPNRFAPLIPLSMLDPKDTDSWVKVNNSNNVIDGKYLLGGTSMDQKTPFGDIYASGYNKTISRFFQFDAGVNFDLGSVVKGLSFSNQLSVDYATGYILAYQYNYATFQPSWNNFGGPDMISNLTKYGEETRSGKQVVSGSADMQTITYSGQFNYVNTINSNHNISGMLLANGFQQTYSQVYQKTNNTNLGLQAGYNFRHKYYFDFTGAVVYSTKLPEGNRVAFSPTVTLGWKISDESFMADSKVIDYMKLNLSGGILNTDLDIVNADGTLSNNYLYETNYLRDNYYGWRDGSQAQILTAQRAENANLGFAKRKEISASIQTSLFEKLVTVDASFFTSSMSGITTRPFSLYPSYFRSYWPVSTFVPYVNYNQDNRTGFDFALNLNKRLGAIDWSLGFSGIYYDTKAVKRDELYQDSYQNRAGKPIDALWGLKSDGFFKDAADVNNSPYYSFGEVKPGDIKYIDQNGDKIIDSKDEVYLGKAGWSGAPLTLGVNLTAKWNRLTLFALCTGRYGAVAMRGNSNANSFYWISGEDKYSKVVRGRWTEATQESATYPRLTTTNGDNNFRNSDFWLYKTNRFDLARVQVTYDFTSPVFHTNFVKGLSVFLAGENLLTISGERETLETSTSPQMRFFNVGLKATF